MALVFVLTGVVGLAAQPKSSTVVRDVADVWIGVALVLVAVGMGRHRAHATSLASIFPIAVAGAITFATHLVTRSERLRQLARHPRIVGICGDLVGPDVHLYWDQAVYKKPEKPRRFPWHQDNGYAFVEPQQYLTCWVALSDATALTFKPARR